ncbi:hypothetical protein M885DRAFT_619597 [Pelagophyceae sp. CCMP2097]|nr:hypothetical protein M885DRAFT_619597 [Pelagophyceae sp. CCMP2097]
MRWRGVAGAALVTCAAADGAPARVRSSMCARCKAGKPDEGGLAVSGEGCGAWCSLSGECGGSEDHQRGLDCRPARAAAVRGPLADVELPPWYRSGSNATADALAVAVSKIAAWKKLRPGAWGRVPYFLHLHKAGGTTLCHVARVANGLNAPTRNCNVAGDGPRTLLDKTQPGGGYGNAGWTGADQCMKRHAYAQKNSLDILAVERWLDTAYFESVLCQKSFFFITILRDPIARILSHCRWERIPPVAALKWLAEFDVPQHEPVQSGTAVVDNFYTRSLLGRQAFLRLGAGAVTMDHANAAMAVLARFDAVLILERLDDSLAQLYARLGWCEPAAHERRKSFGPGDASISFDEAQKRKLSQHNAPDLLLFDFANSLADLHLASLPLYSRRRCSAASRRQAEDIL